MLTYLSKTNGIGGSIKNKPEDFIVEEILSDNTVLELNKEINKQDQDGRFVHFILQKKDWATANALKTIAKKLRISHKRFSQAGTKDKQAVTTQLASVFDVSKQEVVNLNIKDIQINGAWTAKDKVRMGELLGNRFTIKVIEASSDAEEKVQKIAKELNNKFPNYFGEQRFGSTRRNTHIIGQHMLKSRFDNAAMEFLSNSEGEQHEQAKQARKQLAETNDFALALKHFPKHLKMERSMLAWLAKNPNDYANAFRKLPRSILLLFIHAFQSHLFNILLSERLAEGELKLEDGEYFCKENNGFPDLQNKQSKGWLVGKIIGYETELNEREQELVERLGVRIEQFKVNGIPEVGSKGTYRTLLAPLKDFSFDKDVFRFSLASGCYATSALKEFLNNKKYS